MSNKHISNELKILALEAINKAGSGHSGSVLSAGDILYTLYTKHILSDNTKSILRDRFVLSNGHACAGLYAILAGLGYFDIEELSHFRSFGAMLSGHPEITIPGIDCATGPLGQGVANAVGMAIAETMLNAKFKAGHYTYCMAGDGCLQEGVANEALSIAGLYKLNKFILLYDKNNVTLDGNLKQSSNDDVYMKFASMNFNIIECNGHDIAEIDNAIKTAKKCKNKPSVIIFETIIGKDTALANSNLSHGKVYSTEDIEKLRKKLGVKSPNLDLSEKTKNVLQKTGERIKNRFVQYKMKFDARLEKSAEDKELFDRYIRNDFNLDININPAEMSTREANAQVLNEIAKGNENLIVLSADLSSSTRVKISGDNDYSVKNRKGVNVHVGIREHAMGAIANGIALHGGFNVICSTFMTFSNYLLPAIRMASIMKLPVMFAFSHASSYDSPDGTTHLPIEQLDQLRLIPGVKVVRPDDIYECVQSYKWWLSNSYTMCIALSRGKLPLIGEKSNVEKGAYFITEKGKFNIMSSGGEVGLALDVRQILRDQGVDIGVISVPCIEIFEMQDKSYTKEILSNPLFVIESSTCAKYLKYTPHQAIFNVEEFGETGGESELKNAQGFTPNAIANKILKIVGNTKKRQTAKSKETKTTK